MEKSFGIENESRLVGMAMLPYVTEATFLSSYNALITNDTPEKSEDDSDESVDRRDATPPCY